MFHPHNLCQQQLLLLDHLWLNHRHRVLRDLEQSAGRLSGGEEVCERVGGIAPIDLASVDEAIDAVNQSRPETGTAGASGEDGVIVNRPTNPDTTWTSDDPRNNPGRIVTPGFGQDDAAADIADQFGEPADAGGQGNGLQDEQRCRARGPRCHIRPDGGGCHCPGSASTSTTGGTLGGNSQSTPATVPADSDDQAGTDPAGELDTGPAVSVPEDITGTNQFYVIKQSGRGWRKKWAGYAERIVGYETSQIIEVDSSIADPIYRYSHWAYPSFNIGEAAARWRGKIIEDNTGWCEIKNAALCPCVTRPDLWSDGPHYQVSHGPFYSYELARAAGGDLALKNGEKGSAYQWIYSAGNYSDIDNACSALTNGGQSGAVVPGSSVPNEDPPAVDQPLRQHACMNTDTSRADAYWKWYRRIYGGGGFRSWEYDGFICYSSGYYYEYQSEKVLQGFKCDSEWQNCVIDKTYTFSSITDGEEGVKYYRYNDEKNWGTRTPVR